MISPTTILLSATAVTFALGVLGSVLSAGRADQGPSDVAAVLEKVRAALGHAALGSQRLIYAEGTARHHELDGRYRLWFAPSGEFLRQIDCPAGDVNGFDGKTGWAVDWSGAPRILELEGLEATQVLHWIQTGRWLAEHRPFAIELADRQPEDGRLALTLRLKGGLAKDRLLIDRATFLPVALERRSLTGEEIWRFEHYKPVLGFQLAHRLVHT